MPDLIVKELFFIHDPEASQFLETFQRTEGDQVVDEYVGHPQVLHELHVNGQPLNLRLLLDYHPFLIPMDAEVHVQVHREFLVVYPQHV